MTVGQRFLMVAGLLLMCSFSAHAEKLFVTDRVLVGVHQNPSEASPMIKSVPSGTQLEVLETDSGFSRIKTSDGIEGWINSQYLVKQKPAAALLDAAERQLKKAKEDLKAVKEAKKKSDREVQLRRDELANAQSTIKELKKQKGAPVKTDDKTTEKLAAANKRIEQLQTELTELEKKQAEMPPVPTPTPDVDDQALAQLTQENQQLRARIEVALANLNGEEVPSPEELAALHPKFPTWYWGLILTVLVLGFIGGLVLYDLQNRRRHGGFRL